MTLINLSKRVQYPAIAPANPSSIWPTKNISKEKEKRTFKNVEQLATRNLLSIYNFYIVIKLRLNCVQLNLAMANNSTLLYNASM